MTRWKASKRPSLPTAPGARVTIPKNITRIAASGSTSQMILMTVAPELLIGLASSPSTDQMPYFPEDIWHCRPSAQFHGNKANLNMEDLDRRPAAAHHRPGRYERDDCRRYERHPKADGRASRTIYINATMETMPEAYRTLGQLLDRQEAAEACAVFVEKTLQMAEENRAEAPRE